MDLKKINDKRIIILEAKPKNTYSIVSLALFSILLFICIGTILYFGESPVKAFAILFIPLALLIFLLKIVVWNLFGKETIVIHKKSLETTFDYKYIYKLTHKHLPFTKYQLKLRANTTTDILNIKESMEKEYSKSKFKLRFEFQDDKNYQSSISVNQEELKKVTDFLNS